ncbi:MAG TPA: GMC oxidoreductase [Stellaceae bacterium]|nr:GMC oxidoreductase [Stellaceae bacterium]
MRSPTRQGARQIPTNIVTPMAVVDAQLRVRERKSPCLIDASIKPTPVGSNTNAPTIMIAKAAKMIRGS